VATPAKDTLEQIAARVPHQFRAQLKRAADAIAQEAAHREECYRRLIEGYSDLAAIGQAAVQLSALTEPLSARIVQQCDELEKVIRRSGRPGAAEKLEQLRTLLIGLFGRLAMLTPLEHGRNHRGRLIDVGAETELFRSMVGPLLEVRGIHMGLTTPRTAVLRVQMHPESLYRILYLLTINSLNWLHENKEPKICIEVKPQREACEIIFSDNGPGIDPHIAGKVFEPLFSTKEEALGMGLTIARDIVSRHRGTIEVLTDRRRRGANIRILLPRKRSRVSARRRNT
jgi:C4-dicarboxylate-specific signal transduction histidine kinase